MNIGGIVVIALGLFLLVIAVRGTQQQVFPFLFGKPGVPQSQECGCPFGFIMVNGTCWSWEVPGLSSQPNVCS